MKCESCDGTGYWMAPVYHNERQRERCTMCSGTGRAHLQRAECEQASNVVHVDFRKARR